MKKIVIFLGHPAHYHLFKNVAHDLQAKGVKVVYAVKKKDIVLDLVRRDNVPYEIVRGDRKNNIFALIWSVLSIDWNIARLVRKEKADMLIGTVASFWTRILSKAPVVCCNEDDADVVPRFAMMAYPPANTILMPTCCSGGKWDKKATKYPSYHELAYLHPNHFTPLRDVVESYGIDTTKPYFIFRFASLHAHHDGGIGGINTEIAQHLIDILAPAGKIYITSERPLEPQFEQYRIRINPIDMHHVMAFASLYIGDSQTMAAEAGVLGTPFIRFNDFVGRIGYLRELEDVYQLGIGIRASEEGATEKLYAATLAFSTKVVRTDSTPQTPLHGDSDLGFRSPQKSGDFWGPQETTQEVVNNALKEEYAERREKMLSEKIDLAKFLIWFIEEYPESAKVMRESPRYQEQFR